MPRILLTLISFVVFCDLQAQLLPLSKKDSGLIVSSLEKYEMLLDRNDLRGASGALNDAAFVYWNNNHYKEAADYYEKSLKLNEQVANENGIAMINNNLGMLYADLGKYDQSLEKFNTTLAARRAGNEKIGIISALVNMSVVLNNLKRYEESVGHLSEALDIARELYDKQQMRSVYGMLSETYEKMGNVEQSLFYFGLYKTFHEEIQREKVNTVNLELQEERVAKERLEAQKAKQENELLKQRLEIYEKGQELIEKDSITKTLYSDLNSKELELQLLERDKQLAELESVAVESENQKLTRQKSYLRNTLIIVVVAGVIIAVLIILGVYRNRRHNEVLKIKNASIEAQKRDLEIANSTKDRIFSIISHDLRSPISSLQGFFSAIELFDLPPTLKTAFADVEAQLASSASLLENLLNWSKSQIQNKDPEYQEFKVRDLVEDSVRLLKQVASKKEIKLVNSVSDEAILKSDKRMVDIVVRNIIQNAVKFTPAGGEVEINFDHGSTSSHISIRDTGVGMSPEKVEELFDITKNRSTLGTAEEKGTGLGLILCKQLLEKLGGQLGVDSKPGQGSIFKLNFTNG